MFNELKEPFLEILPVVVCMKKQLNFSYKCAACLWDEVKARGC